MSKQRPGFLVDDDREGNLWLLSELMDLGLDEQKAQDALKELSGRPLISRDDMLAAVARRSHGPIAPPAL
jgi:hypothetical protein